MRKLHDYLDCKLVKVTTKNCNEYKGTPVAVTYADESASHEDELDIESDKIYGFIESEIEKIDIIE